jgi:hypothetical protein
VKLREQLRSGTDLPVFADVDIAVQQDDAAQIAPQFVNEYVIERVLDVPVKTLRNWRVSGRGPPFSKFGSSVRYELGTAIQWARERQVNSTSEAI